MKKSIFIIINDTAYEEKKSFTKQSNNNTQKRNTCPIVKTYVLVDSIKLAE